MMNSLGSRSFKRNGIGVTAPVLSDGLAHYTPSGEVRGGVKTTFHSALKNSDVQTSSSGSVTSSRVYDAFGNDLSVTGSWKSPFGYAGQFGYQQDVDTGLKLLGHRYYDSDTGRFLTRDPIKDGRNWYGYGAGTAAPTLFADPSGLVILLAIGIAVAILAIGKTAASIYEHAVELNRQRIFKEENRKLQVIQNKDGDFPFFEAAQSEDMNNGVQIAADLAEEGITQIYGNGGNGRIHLHRDAVIL